MLSVGRPDNTSVRTGFSNLIRLTRSANYIKCNKKLVYPILIGNKTSCYKENIYHSTHMDNTALSSHPLPRPI